MGVGSVFYKFVLLRLTTVPAAQEAQSRYLCLGDFLVEDLEGKYIFCALANLILLASRTYRFSVS